jgi:precorrin-2 dehydrogenase/sirohydrochlorin ferrochelatase
VIPLLHDFAGETVLVFGGGTVGARKARRFDREADVVVVSPAFATDDFGAASLVRGAPDAEGVAAWLDRADPALVVAATDDADLNGALASAARERGVLVNRVDRSGERPAGSVVVPATVREDPVVAALSTGGHSPALSRYLRERIEPELAGAGEMAELTADLRADLKDRALTPDQRREAVRAVVRSRDVWTSLDRGSSKARETAADVVAAVTGDST